MNALLFDPLRKALALFFVLLILAPYAAADGCMYIADRDMWFLQPEQNQMAAIHYEDGMENMLISVSPGANFTGDRAVWIFPVPASPENVQIDVLKGYPRLEGKDLDREFADSLTVSTAGMIFYATFPVSLAGGSAAILPLFIFGMAGNIQKSADIQVYDRVEKMGLVTEVVSATDARAFRNFLLLRGMNDTMDGQELLGEYIGKNYTFVVTSISDIRTYREASGRSGMYSDPAYNPYGSSQVNPIGVFVRFPTERIYFPLRPTAVYGTRQVPVLLYVTGFVSPEVYDTIAYGTSVTYFRQGKYVVPGDLARFFNYRESITDLKYTKVRINTPSDRFTDDLWMGPQPPAAVAVKDLYLQNPVLITIAVYVLISMISSLIAGKYVFRKKTADARTLLLHGLWNCLTFLLFAIMTRKKFPQQEYGKRGPYILGFYLVFGVLLSIYTIALSPSHLPVVLFGWALGLASPVLALGLLFMPVYFLSGLHHMDPISIIPMVFFSTALVLLAVIPVPLLIWLKRWIDPEPLPLCNVKTEVPPPP